MERAVVDTSVLISAAISKKSSPFKIVELILLDKIVNHASKETLEEFRRTLVEKVVEGYFTLSFAVKFFEMIKKHSSIVNPKENFNLCRDHEDNKFLDVAYEAKVDYPITLDKDLLDLRDDRREFKIREHCFKILRPEEFLEELKGG